MFFFEYNCYCDGKLLIEMRNGVVGFFSKQELDSEALDLTANELDATDAAHLHECLEANKMLTSLDMRANRMERDNGDVSEIDRIVRANELDLRNM